MNTLQINEYNEYIKVFQIAIAILISITYQCTHVSEGDKRWATVW